MPPDSLQTNIESILFDPTVGKLVTLIVGLIVIAVLARVVRNSLAKRVESTSARYRTRKLVTLVGYLIAFLFAASVFSDKLGGFTVAFGVAGAGVAFALQEVIASVAGWLAVSFGSFYKPGDRVMLGGIKGDVIDISVLRTTLFEIGDWVNGDLYNGRVVRVANSFVFKEPVFNYSGDFPFVWDEIAVPIRHGSERALTQKIMEDAAAEVDADYVAGAKETWKKMVRTYLIEDAQIEPVVTMTLDQNWMTYTVRYVVNYKKRRGTKHALYERILQAIEASDGRVAVGASTLDITMLPPSSLSVGMVSDQPTVKTT